MGFCPPMGGHVPRLQLLVLQAPGQPSGACMHGVVTSHRTVTNARLSFCVPCAPLIGQLTHGKIIFPCTYARAPRGVNQDVPRSSACACSPQIRPAHCPFLLVSPQLRATTMPAALQTAPCAPFPSISRRVHLGKKSW